MPNHPVPKLLFVAPLPPPVTGMSVADKTLLSGLDSLGWKTTVVNTSKGSLLSGFSGLGQIKKLIAGIYGVWRLSRSCDLCYFTFSQSPAGNLRDLLYVFAMRGTPVVGHLHGGGLRDTVYDRFPLLRRMNRAILTRRVSRMIVLSESLRRIFERVLPDHRIVPVENFADDDFFASDALSKARHCSGVRRVLYLSNMIRTKGYLELARAAIQTSEDLSSEALHVQFAGVFADNRDLVEFEKLCRQSGGILEYLGPINGPERVALFRQADIFCLPTYYPQEGQPISILEAYASGCVVVTTPQGGIPDVFLNGRNGYYVEPRSVRSLRNILARILEMERSALDHISEFNMEYARTQFRSSRFVGDIAEVLEQAMQMRR